MHLVDHRPFGRLGAQPQFDEIRLLLDGEPARDLVETAVDVDREVESLLISILYLFEVGEEI